MIKKLLVTTAAGWYLSDPERRERLRLQALRWVESSATAARGKLDAAAGSSQAEG